MTLEKPAIKIIHNAVFDAARKHYDFSLSPVFDTMFALPPFGRAEIFPQHLAIRLDKSAQMSDWSRRPLDNRQLYHAALDPFATFLYEIQLERGISGDYRLKQPAVSNDSRHS